MFVVTTSASLACGVIMSEMFGNGHTKIQFNNQFGSAVQRQIVSRMISSHISRYRGRFSCDSLRVNTRQASHVEKRNTCSLHGLAAARAMSNMD